MSLQFVWNVSATSKQLMHSSILNAEAYKNRSPKYNSEKQSVTRFMFIFHQLQESTVHWSIIDPCGSTGKNCRVDGYYMVLYLKQKKTVPWIKFHQIRQRSSLAFPKGRRNDRPSRRVPVPSSAMAIISCQNTKVLCYGNVKRASSLIMLILKKCVVQ